MHNSNLANIVFRFAHQKIETFLYLTANTLGQEICMKVNSTCISGKVTYYDNIATKAIQILKYEGWINWVRRNLCGSTARNRKKLKQKRDRTWVTYTNCVALAWSTLQIGKKFYARHSLLRIPLVCELVTAVRSFHRNLHKSAVNAATQLKQVSYPHDHATTYTSYVRKSRFVAS